MSNILKTLTGSSNSNNSEQVSDFTLVDVNSNPQFSGTYEDLNSGHTPNLNISIISALRKQYPELNVTIISSQSVWLLGFAAAGNATADLDIDDESIFRIRSFISDSSGRQNPGRIDEFKIFAKYHYKWLGENFIVYIIQVGFSTLQYILKEPADGETTLTNCKITDELIRAAGDWMAPDDKYIFVYDGGWVRSKSLWDEVQKAKWDDVILDEKMKTAVTDITNKFFNSKDVYRDIGVPWKRGVIFHGPPGNGKTITIKAIMHELSVARKEPVAVLYVKSIRYLQGIHAVFDLARSFSPCLLVLEDIETIVTSATRSYFFNEADGLENNDGIMMIASTNYLERLDPGLVKRPSRFDRKYLFPLPSLEERELYCHYWKDKLDAKSSSVEFPDVLCHAIAKITDDFSFAYMKEAFLSTLLEIARRHTDDDDDGDGDKQGIEETMTDLNKYELWREMKAQVKVLREDMDSSTAGNIHNLADELSKTSIRNEPSWWKSNIFADPRQNDYM